MSGFAQGGTAIKDGGNLKIRGVSPSGVAAQGQVIYRASLWQMLASSQTVWPATTSVAMNTTGTNLLVVVCAKGASVSTVTDSLNNLWTSAVIATITANQSQIFYCIAPITGTSHIFTVSQATAGVFTVLAFKSSASFVLDQTSTGTASSGTYVQLSPLTASAANSLIITGITYGGSGISIDSGFTIAKSNSYVSGTSWGNAVAWLVQGTAAPLTPRWTMGTVVYGGITATMLSFKPS